MARKPRIYYPGAVYHIMLRGNGGMRIFFLDEDRDHFYYLLQEGIRRYDYQIHSFCLMNNHVHLVLRIGNISLSKVIQNLSFRYTRWVNRRQKRIGHLFQGRFKSILVDAESYLLDLVRYVHLNPVRAKLVNKPEDYRWSSHRVYLGLEELPWLTIDWVLGRFGEELELSKSRYQKFMMKEDNVLEINFQKGNQPDYAILAKDDFMKKLEYIPISKKKSDVDLEQLIQTICHYCEIDVSNLKSSSRSRLNANTRALIAILVQELSICSLSALATYFKRDVSGLSKKMKLLIDRGEVENELCKFRKLF